MDDPFENIVDDTDEVPVEIEVDEDRLNTVRIGRLARERRSLIRARSWYLIGGITCAAGAVDTLLKGIHRGLFFVGAILCGIAAAFFFRGAGRLQRQLKQCQG